jgi:RHS repeat-associated protein
LYTSDVHRSYDHAGRLTLDRQQIYDQPSGPGLAAKDVNYEYDKTLRGTDGKPTRTYVSPAPNPSYDYDFRYDNMGRFEKILNHANGALQFQYSYDAASNETQRHNALNGVDQIYNPDSLNRPTTADLKRNGGSFARETYDYSPIGWLHTITRLDNKQDRFGYYLDGELFWVNYGVPQVDAPNPNETPPADDPTKEKTPEDFLSLSGWDPNAALMADRAVNYDYDKAGNRNTVVDSVNGTTAYSTPVPNYINQYQNVGPDAVSNGPEHEIASYKNVSYTYLRDEQLIGASSVNPSNTYQLAYDGLGRCVKRTINGVTKYYIYDGERSILEYGVIGNLRGKNVYGKGVDEILMRWDGTVQSPNPQTFYYQQDHEGSVTHLTMQPDQNGNVILERYRYDVFGTPTIYDKNWTVLTASAVSNRFMFTGREYNANFKFYEYRARAYNPLLGRFMSEDPKLFVHRAGLGNAPADWTFAAHPDEAEFNLFRYCGNDPIDFTDPMGLIPDGPLGPEPNVAPEDRGTYLAAAAIGLAPVLLPAIEAGAGAVVTRSPILFRVVAALTGANAATRAGLDSNKLNHIFGQSKHNLTPVVKQFGSIQKAGQALAQATQAVLKGKPDGLFKEAIKVGDQTVTVKGNIINGIAKISSAYIPPPPVLPPVQPQ